LQGAPAVLSRLRRHREFDEYWGVCLKAGQEKKGGVMTRESGPVSACRSALLQSKGNAAHAGLLLASYLKTAGDNGKGKRALLEEAIQATRASRGVYAKAFDRWKRHAGGVEATLAVRGRVVIGLGEESVLETGLTLHHTYGVPLLPGSGLKGLAGHYCNQVWGAKDPGFLRNGGAHYRALFGTDEESGHITFYDAWILPDSLGPEKGGLVLDVMTPHHTAYYSARVASAAPTDFDDPNPVSFLSAAGRFRVVVTCDVRSEEGDRWAKLALLLVEEALAHWGIGGKTNAGYGRLGTPRT
jgi:CRISPR-associated protein Cmr6